ncbi:MAG: sugar phosphate isomerase/epimerase [Dactylosporangium sp.]|jgi:sugar phosphate isomerase/epimerase|nr:sugar phosphate isomerase/epimerase [Dactylosporangium sp.]
MRRAIISDEISQDLPTAARLAAELGFEGLELRSIDGVPPHLLDDGQLRAARAVLDEYSLRAAGFCPPGLKHPVPLDAADHAASRRVVERALAQAALLGAGHVRIFSFYRDGEADPVGAARVARRVLDGLEWPDGVRLVLETGTRSNTPTLRLALRFLEELGDARIGLLWDPGNTVFSGFDPEPFPGDFEAAASLIRHVHVKDPAGRTGYVRLGAGDLPWPSILAALKAHGYDGWVSLETHWRLDRTLTGPERDEPWGAGISAGGVEASRTCMEVLNGWWSGV